MVINKAMKILTAENFNGYSMSEIIEARNMTLNIMRKYQKIEEVVADFNNQYNHGGYAYRDTVGDFRT